jgi:phospholipase/lecithinase/hemolysin
MAKVGNEKTKSPALTRWLTAALAASFAALLISCGGGGDSAPSASSAAPVDQEQQEFNEAAQQVAEGGDEAAAAVASLQDSMRSAETAGGRHHPRIRRVIVFGDSLSDVGTYKVGIIAQVGGGKFTTNPGPVWSETIGVLLNARVKPFQQGFAGQSQILGGTGFAMGGARVSQQPGIACNPDAQTGACTAALTIPVRQQITDYLAHNEDTFKRSDLVFVLAGANDVLFQLGVFQAKVQAGMPVEQAQAEAAQAIQQAATELVGEVQRIVGKGATRVAVLNLPQLADTPFGKAPQTAPVRPLIAGLIQLFNGVLAQGLQGSGVALLDFYTEFSRVLANPGRFHIRELDVPACDAAKIFEITQGLEQGGSSLFCSSRTLVQQGAAFTYLFADSVHPTTLGHLIVTRFVLIEIWKKGLL